MEEPADRLEPERGELLPEVEAGEALAEVRPLPVLAEPRVIERPPAVSVPAAALAATGGFLLGVATFVLVRVLRRPRRARPARRRSGRGHDAGRIDIAATRSFLVDVHLVDRR